ncbi:hypothetical protein [Flavobacterium sp. NKUCC04_CG]|uniref:hypothetical protein n=1 Tax=Flavobacterium sp. NKUCC04_CG TaxID=2842121 RepID=UPI001C5BC931|nr:hypothetical protein [Flavobacterium sp. NKUCC04_CG]MBW3517827.1 hypothetical protein [Flavobacterium sp. NKUCC04_CG]
MKKVILALKNTTFLSYKGVMICLLSFFWGCSGSGNSEFEQLADSLKREYGIQLDSQIQRILVLTEEDCPSCNSYFAKAVIKYVDDPHSIIIANASGSRVDITALIQAEKAVNNVYVARTYNKQNSFVNKTKVIYLEHNKIDTVVTINARELERQFKYIFEN